MDSMTYWAARDHIKSGDIVHFYAPKRWHGFLETLTHLLIWAVTGSRLFHNGIAVWMEAPEGGKRLMLVESHIDGGKRLYLLSLYTKYEMEVQPLPEQYKYADMEKTLMRRVGHQPYGLMDFFNIGLWKLLRIKSKDFPGQVCSELCAEAWTAAGVPDLTPTWRVSPIDLRERLIKQGIEPTILVDL